jgi:hypothetical protein
MATASSAHLQRIVDLFLVRTDARRQNGAEMMHVMETHDYSFEQLLNTKDLFSSAITNDGWVLYHATSSVSEADIDHNGMKCSLARDNDVVRAIKVFRAMNWCGESGQGYAVLRGASLQGAFVSRLYFRESSMRSLVYAQRDSAGGETVRALHHALTDLRAYLENPSVSRRHYELQVDHCKDLVRRDGCPSHVIRVDMDWLRAQMCELASVSGEIAKLRAEYRFGLVYAVRFESSDLPNLSNAGGEGIVCSAAVPKTRLLAKSRLQMSGESLPREPLSLENHLKLQNRPGIISLLQGRPRPAVLKEHYCARERVCEIKTFAGVDDALQIAMEWGTSLVKDMIRSGKIVFNHY